MGLFKKKRLEDLCPYRKKCAFKDKFYYCKTEGYKDCAIYRNNKSIEKNNNLSQ